jgi:peptide deformylase
MKKYTIVTYGSDILRAHAEPVAEFTSEIKELIEDMYPILVEANGVGLAAPQIGISKRLFVYDIGEGPHALINPVIVSASGEDWAIEGCLSIPGLQGEVPRAERVTVTGIDENGNKVKMKADGLMARCFQHEIDHLDGTMFVDRADPETLETVSKESEDDDEE